MIMSDNRKLFPTLKGADYNSLSAVINKEYCKRHGYDFIYYRPHLPDNMYSVYNCKDPHSGALRHASWSKLLSMSRALTESYDYVVYTDSDCIFKDFDHKIEDFVGPTTADVLVTSDQPYRKTKACAGFFICRVNDAARKFISDWYNVNLPERNIKHSWEQAALDTIMKRPEFGIMDNGNFLFETEGQPLRHVTGHKKSMQLRLEYFSEFIEKNNIPYDISDIRCEEFTT